MNERDIKIVGNMLALAKRGKGKGGKSKRSLMLRTIMPHLSKQSGDDLASAIDSGNTKQFTRAWNKVRDEINNKIIHRHAAHAQVELEVAEAAVTANNPVKGVFEEWGQHFKAMIDSFNAKREAEIAQGRMHPKGSPFYKAEEDPIAHLP